MIDRSNKTSLEENSFYYKFLNENIKITQKFTDCDCEIIDIQDGECTVKACKGHELSIKHNTIKYISFEPAVPKQQKESKN